MEKYYEEIERIQKESSDATLKKRIADKISSLVEDGADIVTYRYAKSTDKIIWNDSDGGKWSIMV
jgi:hypothetical protein